MSEENSVVLPLIDGETGDSSISLSICQEAIKQTEENIKKIDGIISKLQEQANQVTQSLNQGKVNKAILQGQLAIAEEIQKKIKELS